MPVDSFSGFRQEVVDCRRCPRLFRWTREVARVKRRAYRDERYWGRPVPSFGPGSARLLIVGLAPAAHGANRTGRMFTGDRSGDWLYGALHRAGLASQPSATHRGDGLRLDGVRITAVCHCAPPDNRPSRDEMDACAGFLDRELELMSGLRAVLALGQIAWDALGRRAKRIAPDRFPRPRPRFGHGAETELTLRTGAAPLPVVGSYHPSQQNTQTGRLTRPMLDRILRRVSTLAGWNP